MKRVALILGVLGIWTVTCRPGLSSAIPGDCCVLAGMPGYALGSAAVSDPVHASGNSDLHVIATLSADAPRPILKSNPLGGQPRYEWWYGCSPTSGGMMVGYWDSRPGYGNLYYGDASAWGGDGSSGTRRMVASQAHITSGSQNGYTYGDWHNSTSYPTHEANPNCIADFMKTVDGGSDSADITTGLKNYVQQSIPSLKAGYSATTADYDVPFFGGTFSYANVKSEISNNRPVLLDLVTYIPEESGWVGHSIVAYGYHDNMFTLTVDEGVQTVGGIAVRDTWSPGTSGSAWVNSARNGTVTSTIDGNGVEWWPFIQFGGGSYGVYDWMVSDGVTLNIVAAPEPGTLIMLVTVGVSLLAIAVGRRRKPAA
jgi:hypothetical protein